jgi:hypothetical protein
MSGLLLLAASGSGSAALDSQSVFPDDLSSGGGGGFAAWYGFGSGSGQPAFGAIVDGTSDLYSGAAIEGISLLELAVVSPPLGITERKIVLMIDGTLANSGWEKMKIGGQEFPRPAATFETSGGKSSWAWPLPIPDPFTSAQPGPFTTNPTLVEFTN